MKPIVLCILDGVGMSEEVRGNAFKNAEKPFLESLWKKYPHCLLDASGTEVGLPKGQMGNSEVGHMNIGAGRIVYQPLELINQEIKNGTFFQNENILKVIKHTKEKNSKLHVMGLISDGGVHSSIDHLMAVLEMCKKQNVEKLYLHLFTDGRDVFPRSAYSYISIVEEKLNEIGIGKIASITGRYYAMDRDNNYDRLMKAYDVIVNNQGEVHPSIKEYIEKSYSEDITDEFFLPAKFVEGGNVEENDGIIVFNFRRDRLRELFTAITNPDFNEMEVTRFKNVKVVTMLPVVESVKAIHAFDNPNLVHLLGEYVSEKGLKQLRIAETEKYAHVTFFFDGGKEEEYANEKKVLIPSPKVATYDLKPEMSASEVTNRLLEELDHDYDLVILNYANGDMVGHTGSYDAAKEAVEFLDGCVHKIYDKIMELGGTLLVTADHGNCEEMIDLEGNIVTSHTTNKVPFIITQERLSLKDGKLCDIAPTILEIMQLEKPKEMTGESLIIKR